MQDGALAADPEQQGLPSAVLRARSLGSWVHLTAQGVGRISRRWLQMSCEWEQLGGSAAQGRGCQDAPCREAHLPETGWFSPGFALSHLGPHHAVAFTQRVLLGGRALPGQQPSEPDVSTAVRGGRVPRRVKSALGFKRCPGRELAHILWGAPWAKRCVSQNQSPAARFCALRMTLRS